MKKIRLGSKEPPVYALVDDEDYLELSKYKWYAEKVGNITYAIRTKNLGKKCICNRTLRKKVFMHREILNPQGSLVVDHLDFNGLNNQRINLNATTIKDNVTRGVRRKYGTTD